MSNPAPERDVVVVGGGISGLVTAWRLRQAGVDAVLIEAAPKVGGCIRTEEQDGFLLEQGPFNVLVRDETFHQLLDACGDDVSLVRASEAAKSRYVLRAGALHRVPTGPGALVGTPLLSAGGKLRLVRGMLRSRPTVEDEPTIAEAAERRLGREAADTFVSALVAGIFGGDSRKLSLKACFPTIAEFDAEARSPIAYGISKMRAKKKAARAEGAPPPRPRLGLISFDRGLGGLTDWLAAQLGDDLYTGCRVESVTRDDADYAVSWSSESGPGALRARTVALATSKQAAGTLIAPLAGEAAGILDEIESASLVVLNLAYRRERAAHPMQGYGFLVPGSESDFPVMGVLWADSAFPHHAPETHRLIRVFMGGPRDPDAARRDEADLLRVARGAVDGLLGLDGEPDLVDLCRWPDAIPQYHVGHGARLARLAQAMEHLRHLHLVGNYLTGVSINDCVRDATRAAERIGREIEAMRGGGVGKQACEV